MAGVNSKFNDQNPNTVIDSNNNTSSDIIKDLYKKFRSDEHTTFLNNILGERKELEEQRRYLDATYSIEKAKKEEIKNLRKALDSAKSRRDIEEIKNIALNIDNTEQEIKDIQNHRSQLQNRISDLDEKVKRRAEEISKIADISFEDTEEYLKTKEAVRANISILEEQRRQILASNDSEEEKTKQLLENRKKQIRERNKINEKEGKPLENENVLVSSLKDTLGKDSFLSTILSLFDENKIENTLESKKSGRGVVGNVLGALIGDEEKDNKSNEIKNLLKNILGAIGKLENKMEESITTAANTMSSYYGPIKANLEGSAYSWNSITADVDSSIGISRLVNQTDYLRQIADLSNSGLINDIEQRALLETIKDRTLTSFNVRDAALTRLIRLGEQDSIHQFGVELQLKRLLNKKIFGDASYLQGLFDSVTGAIMDAGVSAKSDITNFNSTVQTYLGAMYASGVSDSVVSAIAKGINALGSGNVQALAQDESIQRLFLLSMDRINMNYADVLQQGLSSDDTSKLLASVITYLSKIADNTEDNLVLKSSYSNLFNLSLADIQAIQNITKKNKLSTISSSIINKDQAKNLTVGAVKNIVSQNTLASQQIDNAFANLSYLYGSNIADNSSLYSTYRAADYIYDSLDSLSNIASKGVLSKAITAARLMTGTVKYGVEVYGLLPLVSEIGSLTDSGNALTSLLELPGKSSGGSSGSASSGGNALKRLAAAADGGKGVNIFDRIGEIIKSKDDWSKDEDDEGLNILKEMSKTLMKINSKNYAFAVSLEGMSNEVLKSFASIFADEDAMQDTFEGDNKVLEDALFEYFDDTTSNSVRAKKTSKK